MENLVWVVVILCCVGSQANKGEIAYLFLYFWKYKYVITFQIINRYRNITGCWYSLSVLTRIWVSIVRTDDPMTRGVRSSAATTLTQLSTNILFSPNGLIDLHQSTRTYVSMLSRYTYLWFVQTQSPESNLKLIFVIQIALGLSSTTMRTTVHAYFWPPGLVCHLIYC